MITISNLTKEYVLAEETVKALDHVSLEIKDGDIYGIIGMSGAGKSTLVRTINMLERPTSGEVLVDGVNVGELPEKELQDFRRSVTMIFQGFHLLQQKNVIQNVAFPLYLEGIKKKEALKRAEELLALVGLADKAKAYPVQLSGGQQQRVAIARALATNPKVLLCDEATSALDPMTTEQILSLIQEINEKLGVTVILITHQMSVVNRICKHVAILDHGILVEQGEVTEVFTNPTSKVAKELILPKDNEDNVAYVAKENALRVVFHGAEAANKSLVALLAKEKGILANISYASTKGIGGRAYGTLILDFENHSELEEATKYFQGFEGISVEEWKND